MKRAIRQRELQGFAGHAALYKLGPPIAGHYVNGEHEYVIVSAVRGFTVETLIFPANSSGEVVSWGDVGGIRGKCSHEAALRKFGYEIEYP